MICFLSFTELLADADFCAAFGTGDDDVGRHAPARGARAVITANHRRHRLVPVGDLKANFLGLVVVRFLLNHNVPFCELFVPLPILFVSALRFGNGNFQKSCLARTPHTRHARERHEQLLALA